MKSGRLSDICFFLHTIPINIPPIPRSTAVEGSGTGAGAGAGSPDLICKALTTASGYPVRAE